MPKIPKYVVLLVAVAAVAVAGWLYLSGDRGHTERHSPVVHPAEPGHRGPAPAITKVMVIVVENHSLAQMEEHMPSTFRFATEYAYATRYHAVAHPSLPNYLAMVSGSTHGISDDRGPDVHVLPGQTVFDQALARGKTAGVYADAMPGPCARRDDGTYAVRHNPWVYFPEGRAACEAYDVPVSELGGDAAAGALPNIGLLVPSLVHDAHDASLEEADSWIAERIETLTSGPDWDSGRLAIVVTADEDDRHAGNRVLTVVGARYLQPTVVESPLDHYSLARFLSDVVGAPHLGRAATAPDLAEAFGLRLPDSAGRDVRDALTTAPPTPGSRD